MDEKQADEHAAVEQTESKTDNAQKWKCIPCGYIYDPAKGDPEANVQPGTSFEQLPEDWVCPVCGADKSQFEAE